MAGVPTEQELLSRYLPAYVRGQELQSNGAISSNFNPYIFKPDVLPQGIAQGSLGILCYTDCNKDQRSKNRYVDDRSGYWMPKGGELRMPDGSGFRRSFQFVLLKQARVIPTTWEMIEYTIHSSNSAKNKNAICAIRNAGNSGQ